MYNCDSRIATYDFLYIYKRVHYVTLYVSHVEDFLWSGCIDNTCGLNVVLFGGSMKKKNIVL